MNLLDEALKLPSNARAALVDRLIASLDVPDAALDYYDAQRVRLGDEFRDEAWERSGAFMNFLLRGTH